MKGIRVRNLLSILMVGVMLLVSLTACSDKKVDVVVSATPNGKVTSCGAVEYNGQYFIWDKNGINYKKSLDEKSIVVAHTSKANGTIQNNFAVSDEYLFFKSSFGKASSVLYRTTLKGQKREKIYVRDVINIVGVHNNNVYITDEQNILKCISGETCLEVDISLVKGTQFVQKNNHIFYRNVSGSLKAYNCDTDTVLSEILGENVDSVNACENGIAYVSDQSAADGEYKLTSMFLNTTEAKIFTKGTIQTNQPLSLTTESFSFINNKNDLMVYNNKDAALTEEKQSKPGKLIYNYAISDSAYYVNEKIWWEYNPDSFEKQPMTVDYTKNNIDYNKIFSIVDGYVIYLNNEGYYEMLKIN